MPDPSSDNQNKPQPFSVDDMMDRLKVRPETTGSSRVVTREVVDGRSVEVVRKRKRRTHQPKKEKEKRMNRMKRTILLVILPLGLALIGAIVMTVFRYQSDSYRNILSDRLSELLGVRTEVRRLQVKGLSNAATTGVLVTGPEGSVFKEAEFGTVKAELTVGSFFSRSWDMKALMIQSANVVLHPPTGNAAARAVPEGGASLLLAGLGLSPNPTDIEMEMLRITACDLTWDPEQEEVEPQLIVDSALVSTTNFGPDAVLAIRGGQLRLPGWPKMDLDKGEVALKSGSAEIRSMTMKRETFGDKGGSARMKGTVSLQRGGETEVVVDLKGMELRGLVPEIWAAKVRGAVTTELTFRSLMGSPGSLQAEGDFSLADAVIGDLSSLKQLATYAGEAKLTRLAFDTLTGHYRKSALGVEFTKLEGEVIGTFRVRGGFSISANGTISGQLEVGLPEILLSRRSGGKPSFFGSPEDGYCWVKTTLSGRHNEPQDDLSPRFEAELSRQNARDGQLELTPGPRAPRNPDDAPRTLVPANPPAATDRDKMLEDTFDNLIGE